MPRPLNVSLRAARALLLVAVIVYLAQGVFYTRVMISSDDEEAYLGLGYMAAKGEISLYQDEVTGQRMPIPFYVLGYFQRVMGTDLWAARLFCLFLGLGALLVTARLAARLGGDAAGALAALLLATQGAVVSYYATAGYHSMTALVVIAAVAVFLSDRPWRFPLGMVLTMLLFFMRTTMFPAVPFLAVWALVGAPTSRERLAVLGLAVTLPLAFFASDPTHVKVLAHIPVASRLAEPYGYRSIFLFQEVSPATFEEQVRSILMFGRRYESLVYAVLGVVAAATIGRVWRRWHHDLPCRALALIFGLSVWILLWHFVAFRIKFKWVIAYFPDVAPLFVAVLAVAMAAVFRHVRPLPGRAVLGVALAVALTVSVVFVRNPLVPTPLPRPFDADPIQRLDRSAARLHTLVPENETVFLVGNALLLHLAGRRPFHQQLMGFGTLTANDADLRLVARSGVWGRAEIERWLGHEAAVAVVSPAFLDALAVDRRENIQRIRTLLQEHFVRVARLDDAPWLRYDVYHRQ